MPWAFCFAGRFGIQLIQKAISAKLACTEGWIVDDPEG